MTDFYALLIVAGLAAIPICAWYGERRRKSKAARSDAAYRKRMRDLFRASLPADRTVRR